MWTQGRKCGQGYEGFAPRDAVDHNKRREMIRENWSDSNSESDAKSSIRIVRSWYQLTQVDLNLRPLNESVVFVVVVVPSQQTDADLI